jgi:hypothetical protein
MAFMNHGLVLAGLVSIPTGAVMALTTPIGITGALVFISGAGCGAFAGRYLARALVFTCMPLNENLQQITAVMLIHLATVSSGWALTNLCGFVISFKVFLLAQLGGVMLLGACVTLLLIIDKIKDIFSRAF